MELDRAVTTGVVRRAFVAGVELPDLVVVRSLEVGDAEDLLSDLVEILLAAARRGEPLEVLTGDPGQIDAVAQTWENIGKRLTEAHDQYQGAMSLTDGWTGDAAATDPVVMAHGRALLAENDRTHFADADFRYPDQVLQHPTVRKYLDFTEPIAVYHIGSIQYVSDKRRPAEIIAGYVDAIPSGSYVVGGPIG
ncbi:SAM-dependent methyltransferase [Kibdelosporangium lantanae]|uniref:SAM-dependent methyltransferase n=1 Tax=Kibdelosporangium lantanae TaxID=1497396 RepID=A0ABW3MHF3_9PSEU